MGLFILDVQVEEGEGGFECEFWTHGGGKGKNQKNLRRVKQTAP